MKPARMRSSSGTSPAFGRAPCPDFLAALQAVQKLLLCGRQAGELIAFEKTTPDSVELGNHSWVPCDASRTERGIYWMRAKGSSSNSCIARYVRLLQPASLQVPHAEIPPRELARVPPPGLLAVKQRPQGPRRANAALRTSRPALPPRSAHTPSRGHFRDKR
jgi:hypothetical protein